MTAQELYDGVARAVEAAKPAQEYCFLWIDWWPMCMTKAEWSGWMQAIGSVLALAIAVSLPFLQAKFKRDRNFEAAKHALFHQLGALEAVKRIGAEISTRAGISAGAPTFSTGVLICDQVRANDLPINAWPCWQGVVTSAAQLKEMSLKIAPEGADDGYQRLMEDVEKNTRKSLNELLRHDPRWITRIRRTLTSKRNLVIHFIRSRIGLRGVRGG